MRTNRKIVNILPRITAIALAMLIAAGNLNLTNASGPANASGLANASGPVPIVKKPPALVTVQQTETGAVHRPLATVGITQGQTARINMVSSPDPSSSIPPGPITVELCFHDSNGNLILDRSGRPVQKTATIDPHHGDFLDLNGNLVAAPGARVVIIPCVRILQISEGTLAIPTLELYNNTVKTSFALSPGIARGFDPQPDPPLAPEVAFGLVGITQGVTARLYVLNAQNPSVGDPHNPITVEMEFHDANGNSFLDRKGLPTRKIVTLNPDQADFLELNGNDIASPGARVGIMPCVKVLKGAPSSLMTPTFETFINLTQQTLLLSNFQIQPDPVRPPVTR